MARRLDVQVGRVPWGIDRIDTNGESAVRGAGGARNCGYGWPTALPSAPQLPTMALLLSFHSSLALPTGGPTDGEYDDGDLVLTRTRTRTLTLTLTLTL